MNIKDMKAEALERIKLLDLHPDVAKAWEEDGTVYYSEPSRMLNARFGVLYWLHNHDEYIEAVKKFEKDFNALCYHALYANTAFGELLACLYVSDTEEDWAGDKDDLKNKLEDGTKQVMSYCINLTDPLMSEFGYIGIREAGGGLIRDY